MGTPSMRSRCFCTPGPEGAFVSLRQNGANPTQSLIHPVAHYFVERSVRAFADYTRGVCRVIVPLLSPLSSARNSGRTKGTFETWLGELMELTRARLGSSRNRLTTRHWGASFQQIPRYKP